MGVTIVFAITGLIYDHVCQVLGLYRVLFSFEEFSSITVKQHFFIQPHTVFFGCAHEGIQI